MKLHLPIGLRAALLAVLLCSPVAMGNVKVYQGVKEDGTGGTEVIPMDGKIDIMDDYGSLLGDVVITVDGETTGGDGLTALTYHGNMENCRTTITVESGGTFTCQGGSMIGTATAYASLPIESETIFNVSGGTVDLGGVGVGVVSEGASSARSSVIFNISENGQVLSSSSSIGGINGGSSNHSEVTMNLTSGGKLKIGSTTFGGKFGLVENTDSSSVVTISVDGENSSVELGAPSIGNVSAANSTSVVDIDVTQHGSFKLLSNAKSSLDSNPSGSIGTVSSADSHSDVYITVAGEESLFEIASYWQTIGTVSTSKGGVQHLGSSTTKIEVREGGVFTHKMGDVGLNKSTAATPKGGSAATTELMLTVDGGIYNMGFCDDRQGSHLGGVGTQATGIHGKNTTEIHVQNNGQFNFRAKRGYIGASYNDGSDVTLNIFLDKGGVFSFERYEDDDTKSQVETHIGYACGGNVNFTLDVGADSKFSVLPQSKAQQIDQSIGAAQAYLNTTSEVSAKVDIYLHDGGTMDFRPTTITSFSRVHFAGMGISYGKSDKKVSAATSITVGNKEQQTEAEGMSEGAASTFNFGGGDIGLAWVSGDGKVENTAAITVNEGGQFEMTGGRLGYVNVSSNGKGTVKQDLSLTLNGGDMTITGGSILASEGGRTAGTSERTASIELSGDSVLTIGEGVTIGSDVGFAVTMHGGKLAGEGISKLTEKVSTVTIDTGDQFKGEIGLGGIGAEKITSIKINSGDIAIVDIGEGTLTLGAEDILTVGENSAWDGKDVSPAPGGKQALLQFKTEKSGSPSEGCTVDVNGKVTLNFDGQYLAEQKGEDGTVTLRVWITNGKLAGEGETSATWAEEHFEIGTGWGLEVQTYDAAKGMLILEGTSTVWVATVDGDEGDTGHAAANASALEDYTKVIVDEGTTFTADRDATIQQLTGIGKGSQLDLVKEERIESATITLNNADKEGSPGTGNTVFERSITVGEGVNLRKTGDAILAVQGNLQAKGDVTVAQGTLTLGGEDNSIGGTLTVGDAESGTSGTLDVQGNLSAKGAVKVAAGELVLEGDNNTVEGALSMGADGTLKVKQALTLSGTSNLTAGAITGRGVITVTDEGSLTVGEGVTLNGGLSLQVEGAFGMNGGQMTEGTLVLSGNATMTQTGGQITGSAFELSDNATLTQSDAGTINGSTITLSGSETRMEQTGGQIIGGTLKLSGGATMTQTGGQMTGGMLDLSDGANLTQSGAGTISGSTITLSGGATMTQSNGAINGSSVTLSGEGTGFTQSGGSIGGDATFELSDGATLTLSGGSMNAAVTMEGEASRYDLGSQAAQGSITMHGGNLAKAENYAGTLAIQTEDTYTGALDLGGVDAARITQVKIGASGTELRNLKSGSTLTFRGENQMVVGEQHVYREGQTEPAGGTMVQFQEEKGQIAFDEAGKLQLHLKSEVLKDLEGQMEILFTNGSFSGMPEGGQKELEAWLKEHFVLDAGLEDIKVLLLNDAEGGHLILTGSSSGIWIASRNGQNVDVADLLNKYSAVIADEELILTLPTTQEETLTIVNQLQNESETHGDFIVKTESGATAGHTVQLHNANTNGDNGSTDFYGNIRVEGTELEAATLEKTGDAALNVHGNVESSGAVQVKEGTLALLGEANSIGTLAMSGGKLQVNGALELTGATEMSEESSGSISGEGNVKLGSGASLTLAGGVSYEVQNTQLENGAQMSQKGETAINGGSITLSGEGTSYTQEGGSIGKDVTFSVQDGATLTLSGGSMNAAVTMEGNTSRYDLGNQTAQGSSITMHGGSLAHAGNYAGSLAIRTDDTYTGALDLGGVNAALITSIQLAGKDTYLTGLMGGSTLTLHAGDSFKITEQNVWVSGEEALEGKQAIMQFGTVASDAGNQGTVDVEEGAQIKLDLDGKLVAAQKGHVTLEVWLTNGRLKVENSETWAKEHFTLGTGWGLSVESWDAKEGRLILSGESNIWDAAVDGTEDAVGHVSVNAKTLSQFDKVVIDERTTVTAEGPDGVVRQLEGSKDLEIQGSGTVAFENKHEESAFVPTGDTTLHGNIVAGDEVDLRKTGDASLTVDGDLKAGGDVAVEEGKLAIGGKNSSIDGELSLGKKGAGEEAGTSGELQVDGKLTLSGGVSEDSQGSITGSGTVVLDGDFTMGEGVELGKDLTFQMGKAKSADFGDKAVTFQDLEGDKTVKAGGVTLAGEGTFSGTITGDTTMQGEYALNGANIDGTLDNSGKESVMILSDASEEPLQVQKDLVLRKDATTRIFMDLSNGDLWQDASDTMVNVSRNIIIEDGTIFEIHNLKDIIASNEDLKNVVIMRGAHVYAVHGKYTDKEQLKDTDGSIGEQKDEKVKVNLTGTLNWRYKEAYVSFMNSEAAAAEAAEEKVIALFREATPAAETETLGSTVSLTLIDQDVNPVVAFAGTSNEKAGAALVSGHVLRSSINGVDPDVERMAEGIAGAMESNPSAAHRALAAVAGSTLTSVSAAQSAALRNQMGRVRDHALQAGRLRCQGNAETTAQQRPCKNSHVWVEGTSFFSEQHSVGDESGYRLNSWGGAVGIDAQVDAHWSVGVSLSASYGDLEARAADYAKGDLDTYTVSFWSQAKNGRWGNTLLFTLGTNEADLKRTVNYGAGSYTATSNTSGSSLGAMWEVTYDLHPVKDNKSNILQPLFNVAVMHTSMDGFSEKNAGGVGLTTEKQTRDTVTLGLGLRWLAAINSAKAVNRTVSTEVHANVAQDMGDRRSVANVALLADPSYTQNVYGSKAGSTAFQFGAGVNVPMTPNSQIYVNAGGELREHANAWNAALGVRMGF